MMTLACLAVLCPANEYVEAEETITNIQIIGIVEGQKIAEGKKITLRGSAHGTDGSGPEDLTYSWYAGTTLIGQTQDITWKVRGSGHTPIRLLVEDRHGNEADLVINITVRDVITGCGPTTWDICLPFVAIGVVVTCVVAFSIIAFYRLGQGPPPPDRGR
jgi:hypothetical protein